MCKGISFDSQKAIYLDVQDEQGFDHIQADLSDDLVCTPLGLADDIELIVQGTSYIWDKYSV